MQILQICDSVSGGGLEIYFVRLVNSLSQLSEGSCGSGRSWGDVWVYCRKGSFIDKEIVARKIHSLKEIRRIRAPRLIHIHRSADLWRGVFVKALTGAALLFTNHMGSKVSKRDAFHRLLYSRVDRILAISDAVRGELLRCLPIKPDRLRVLHLGVDLEKFSRKQRKDSDSILIGCSSRIESEKGQRELILAFNRIAKDYPSVRLELAGRVMDHSYYAELQKVKNDRVNFLGVLGDVRPFLERLHIYVFPSHGEAFGLALCEAMALELPCIACGERGTKEIIEDGRSGILVGKSDIAGLEKALRTLLENRLMRRKLGREARKRVESSFNWKVHIEKLTGFYEDLSIMNEKSGG